jgi:hypothetical protein
MIRFYTSILEATADDDIGFAHVFSFKGTASSQSETMIGSQVGEPYENKLIIDGERSTAQSFKSIAAPKDGILTCLLTAEKHATSGPNLRRDRNGSGFHLQRPRQLMRRPNTIAVSRI